MDKSSEGTRTREYKSTYVQTLHEVFRKIQKKLMETKGYPGHGTHGGHLTLSESSSQYWESCGVDGHQGLSKAS